MTLLFRPLLRSTVLAVALLAASASGAEGAQDRLRAIAKEAAEVLQVMSQQLRELQYRFMGTDSQGAAGGRVVMSSQNLLMDLQRNADRLKDLGSEANSRASGCDKDVRDIARDFLSQARRISSSTNRIAPARERTSSSSLALDQIDFALQRAYDLLPSLGSITECSREQAGEAAGEQDGEQQEKKKKEEDKRTEDYNE